MQISPAELTEQESQIVRLIQNDNNMIFDYTVDPDVKSISTACYKLDENGKWVVHNGEGSMPINSTSGRMAFSFGRLADGYRVAVQESDNTTANENETMEKIDTQGMSFATSFASTENIEYEKEIPLAIQVFTSKNEISSCGVEFYNKPEEYKNRGYEDVYVLTIKFSKKALK